MNKKISSVILSFALLTTATLNSSAVTSFERIAGNNRYETSMKTAAYNKSDLVVFASGKGFADALSSTNIANKFGATLILVSGNENMTEYLKNNNIKKAYIIGGPKQISNNFESKIRNVCETKRLSGSDRYKTNLATLEETEYKKVGIATGQNYADALSASSLLKQIDAGLMLVNNKTDFNNLNHFNIIYEFGGKNSIYNDIGTRIEGENRYETSANIATLTNSYKKSVDSMNIVFVSGENYADALNAINIANAENACIILLSNSNINSIKILADKAKKIFAVGGEKSLNSNTINNLFKSNETTTATTITYSDKTNLIDLTLPINWKKEVLVLNKENENENYMYFKSTFKQFSYAGFVGNIIFSQTEINENQTEQIGTIQDQHNNTIRIYLQLPKYMQFEDTMYYYDLMDQMKEGLLNLKENQGTNLQLDSKMIKLMLH